MTQLSTQTCPLTSNNTNMPSRLPHLTNIFTSLSHNNRRWSLLRTLHSDNPLDINGELRGTATFTPLRSRSPETKPRELLYREEGELPNTFGMGLSWSKKYIWRQAGNGGISVWFVKVKPTRQEEEEEADYLFHNFDFEFDFDVQGESEEFVTPPTPPPVPDDDTLVVLAKGNHLCINDMYRTAYAFRIRSATGEVVSWSSRHVVKGPKKNQDIVNLYRMEE